MAFMNGTKVMSANYMSRYNEGYEKGFRDGHVDGRKEENREWFTAYQKGSDIVSDARSMFYGSRWTDETFKPVLNLIIQGKASSMFNSCYITDLAGILEQRGITLNTSGATALDSAFGYSSFTHLPIISCVSVTKLGDTFKSNRSLHTIDGLVLNNDGTTEFPNTFQNCGELTTIGSIVGKIGKDVHFDYSPKLSHETLIVIMNALMDYSNDTSGDNHYLYIGETNYAKLSETADLPIAWNKGWTVV